MARNSSNQASAENSATPAAEASGDDSRFVMIDVPSGDPSGLSGSQKRVDVIRALLKTGDWTRGDTAKHISKLQGTKVAYQIVFQAGRGISNIKKAQKKEEAATSETPATEEVAETEA